MGLSRTEFLLTETMDQAHSVEFYRQISRSDPAAMHMLIQAGAGFHLRAGDPSLPDHARAITLPACSPELNPIEGLWDQIKDRHCNRVFDTLARLEAGLQTERQRFCQTRNTTQLTWLALKGGFARRLDHPPIR